MSEETSNDNSGTGDSGENKGTGEGNWYDGLPNELKELPFVTESKTLEAVVRRGVDTQKALHGRIKIPGDDATPEDRAKFDEELMRVPGVARIPGEGASPEQIAAFNEKMGVPKQAADYEIKRPDQLADDQYSQYMEDWARGIGIKYGFNQAQMAGLVDDFNELQLQTHERVQADKEKATAELKIEFGEKLPEYEKLMKEIMADPKYGGSPELAQELDAAQISNSPRLAKMLMTYAKMVAPERIVNSETTGGAEDQTFTELESQYDKLLTELTVLPLGDGRAPELQARVDAVAARIHERAQRA